MKKTKIRKKSLIDIVKYQEEDKEVGKEEVSVITYERFMQKKSHRHGNLVISKLKMGIYINLKIRVQLLYKIKYPLKML